MRTSYFHNGAPCTMPEPQQQDPRDERIAELEAENAILRERNEVLAWEINNLRAEETETQA